MTGESSPRIAAQEFASSLKAIEFTALILFRDIGGKPPTAEWRGIQLADACNHFDQCVKSIELLIADKVGTAIDSNPRKWFANTLTALKRLVDRPWLYDHILRHTDLDRLDEDQQADLERLRQEVECRAEELESAALTLPADEPAKTPASELTKTPPDKVNGVPGYLGLIVEKDGTVQREGFDPTVQVSGPVAWPMFLALSNAADAGLSKQELARLLGEKNAAARRRVKKNLKDKLHRPLNITIPRDEWKLAEA